MRYLLDTSAVSDLMRHPQGRVAERIAAVGEANICTSIIVAAELRYGAAKGSTRLADRVESVLAVLEVLPLKAPADVAYGELRAQLEREGRPIGGNDLLIAAQALALGCSVVTANQSEFGRVPGLRHENWLA